MKKIKKIAMFILFMIIVQFWRVNNLSDAIINPEKISINYYMNNEIIYLNDRFKFDKLSVSERIDLLGRNQFYLIYGWDGYRTAHLIFDENNQLIYYSRDLCWDDSHPEDFNEILMDNEKIYYFWADKTIPLRPNILDRLDAKLVWWFAYTLNWLGLD